MGPALLLWVVGLASATVAPSTALRSARGERAGPVTTSSPAAAPGAGSVEGPGIAFGHAGQRVAQAEAAEALPPSPDAGAAPGASGASLAVPGSSPEPAADSPTAVSAADAVVPAEAPGPSTPWAKTVDATGYAGSRFSFTRSRTWGLLPTEDQPQVSGLVELNTQVKVSVRPRSYAYSDVSLVANAAGAYHGWKDWHDVYVEDHATAASTPVVSLNELYLQHEVVPALTLLVGKKRVTWGSGVAFNPTDLLNPRRDPTDPTSQRAGAWLAQVEAPLEHVTFSLLFAPTVLAQQASLPTRLMFWPPFDQRDDHPHFQLAARVYALVADADVSLMAFYGNQSVDEFKDKVRLGLSFSRYFFTDYELHVEAIAQQGSTRQTLNPDCVESRVKALLCSRANTPALEQTRLDDEALFPRVLVGTRRQFSDESMLSLEYLYQSDGWTTGQYQDFANGLDLFRQGREAGLPVGSIPGASALVGGGTSADGVPQRFSFEPRAQHYLFASYQKPKIADDFTASLVLVANLQDLSTLLTPSFAWAATDWLTLTLYGFVPLPGPESLAATTSDGRKVSEYGVVPFTGRVMFEARAWY